MVADVTQVPDDPELLTLMLEDTRRASDIYKPTNYWAVYEKQFFPELQQQGLHNFRRRKFSILSRFGATDLAPVQFDFFKIRKLKKTSLPLSPLKCISFLNGLLNRMLHIKIPYSLKLKDLRRLAFQFVRLYGEKVGAKSINEFEASLAGNPEDIIEMGGKMYTMSMLYYYMRYVYCCKFINFDETKTWVELGSGSGKQVEVIKKLHPDLSFLVFDIPPQLYVCHQYLSTVFPDSVISYKETRDVNSISEPKKGKIFIFGNWKFPIIERLKTDLFWSAASFQEMEPDVAANYLKYVNNVANFVFLQQNMSGKRIAAKKWEPAVLKQTKLEDYKAALTNFKLIDLSPSLKPTGDTLSGYSDSFWKRKGT